MEDQPAQRCVGIRELLVRIGQAHGERPIGAEQDVVLPVHRDREFQCIGVVGDAIDAETLEGETRLLRTSVGARPAGDLPPLEPTR